MKEYLWEVLSKVKNANSKKEKVELLKKADHPLLRKLLEWTYSPNLKMKLPDKIGYRPDPAPTGYSLNNLWGEVRRLYIFDEKLKPELSDKRRLELFIQLLEGIDKGDAELLLEVKNKEISGIPKSVVESAFPDLLKGDKK